MSLPFSSIFGVETEKTVVTGAAVKAARDKFLAEKETKKTEVTVQILHEIDSRKTLYLEALRAARKAEKEAKESLTRFNLAVDYFGETGNFGPLSNFMCSSSVRQFCQTLGVQLPTDEDKKVPDGWKATTSVE